MLDVPALRSDYDGRKKRRISGTGSQQPSESAIHTHNLEPREPLSFLHPGIFVAPLAEDDYGEGSFIARHVRGIAKCARVGLSSEEIDPCSSFSPLLLLGKLRGRREGKVGPLGRTYGVVLYG